MRSERPSVLEAIEKQKALDDPLVERLKAAISTFNHQFGVEGYTEVPDPAPKAEPQEEPKEEPKAEAKPAEKPKPTPRKKATK